MLFAQTIPQPFEFKAVGGGPDPLTITLTVLPSLVAIGVVIYTTSRGKHQERDKWLREERLATYAALGSAIYEYANLVVKHYTQTGMTRLSYTASAEDMESEAEWQEYQQRKKAAEDRNSTSAARLSELLNIMRTQQAQIFLIGSDAAKKYVTELPSTAITWSPTKDPGGNARLQKDSAVKVKAELLSYHEGFVQTVRPELTN